MSSRGAASRSIPARPVFLSLGMPPAKSPPSCGAAVTPESGPPPPPASELLLALLAAGGSLVGAFGRPGIGGAPPTAGALLCVLLLTIGAERSLTTPTFLSRAPFEISPSKAPFDITEVSHETLQNHGDRKYKTHSVWYGTLWWWGW